MKKILSIGNLFVKRIGLVAILLATIGVGDVWAKAKSTVNATANPSSGAGTAQVSASATSGFGSSATQTTGGTLTAWATHTYYLKATTTSAAWLWKGWYNNGVLAVSAQTSNIQVKGTASLGGGSNYTYTATWLQPKVTGTTAGEDGGTNIKNYVFGPYTDPNVGSETRDVVFTLESNESGLTAKDGTVPTQHFTEAITGSWTATTFVKNSSDFPGIDKSSYTYNVTYKLSGVHGTSVTADIKVTSKYGGSNCTARLVATEDYMPYFNYAYEEYNYTPDDPLAEGQFLTQTFNVSKNCYAANNGVWSVSLPADAASKGFTLQSAANEPNAVVKFEALPDMNKADLTTTLTATCTYTDAKGAKVTYTQTILLSGDAGKVITIDGAEVNTMTFDIDYAASGESTQTLPFMTTLTGLTTTPSNLPAGDFITYTTWIAGLTEVSASVKHNLTPGQYTPSIKYSYNSDEVYSILNIVANIRLAQPVVTAVNGLGQSIDLSWPAVYGATSYIVKSGETIVATIEDPAITVDNIGGKPLVIGTEYPFTVTAVYEPNAFGNRTSDEIKATPTAPTEINSLTEINIYTGTEKAGAYPYHKDGKRLVDLSAAFKDGKAIFDQLFIFGLTTGDASNNITVPTATTNSNAVTPCYIYKKSGDNYVLDQTIENVNVATKPSAFNITASGQKVYFTGYAPSISCGSTWEENGVFFISGQNNIDLYFDNLQLFARPKSQNGTTTVSQQKFSITGLGDASILYRDDVDGNIGLSGIDVKFYTQGTGSVFCFQPIKNGSTFTPKIHLLNDNLLESTQGVHLYVYVNFILSLDRNASQHSAPIQVIHNKNTIGTATELTIDDVWNSQRTNGVLNLARLDSRPAPTIDLGYENTTLNINGGQLFLSNSFNNSDSYDVSYAISYRQKSMMDGLAVIYGLGDDQPGGTVLFNDGTINCKPLREQDFNSTQGQKLFHNPESMKCPQNTYIRGGSFNCNVLACSSTTSKGASPKNDKNGDALCVVSIPVKSINANNTAVLPDNWVEQAVEKGAKPASEVLYGGSYNYYKTESMTPETVTIDDEEVAVVNLMLPSYNICFKEVLTTPWVACFPQMTVSALTQSQDLGGDVEVPFALSADDGLTKVVRTSKLLYGEIDHYLVNLIEGVEIDDGYNLKYEIPSDGETRPSITLDNEAPGASCSVINEAQYAIYDKVYMVMPLVANQWKMFVPPFDVANVYVIEPYAEADLLNQYDDNHDGKLTNGAVNEVTRARYAQAYRNMDFLYSWIYSIVGLQSNSDIWSNASQAPAMGNIYSYGTFMQTWLEMYEGMADKPTVNNCIQQLYHYKSNNEGYPAGMTRWDANFYLYEADATEWTIGANSLNTGWKEVPTISMKRKINEDHNVIMKKGGVYVMNFPSTIKNNEIYDYINTWDYWTGKYIILEGYPEEDIDTDGNGIPDDKAQILSGSQYDWNGIALTETLLAPYETENVAALRGNTTFSKLNISGHDNAYVLNNYYRGKNVNEDISRENEGKNMLDPDLPHNVYVDASSWSLELSPGEGFVLANIPDPAGMKPRAINIKTGEITYRDETTTSLPTIGGNKQMMVYNIEGGVGIVPVVEQQVSIYNTAGQVVKSQYLTEETHIALPAGIYLIAGAKEQFKVVVK